MRLRTNPVNINFFMITSFFLSLMQLRGHYGKKIIYFIIKIFYKDLAEIKSTPVDIRPLAQATDVSIFSAESGIGIFTRR